MISYVLVDLSILSKSISTAPALLATEWAAGLGWQKWPWCWSGCTGHHSMSLCPFLLLSSSLKWCLMLKYDLRKAEWTWTYGYILYCSLSDHSSHFPSLQLSFQLFPLYLSLPLHFSSSPQRAIIITPFLDTQAIKRGLPLSCAHLPWWVQNQ